MSEIANRMATRIRDAASGFANPNAKSPVIERGLYATSVANEFVFTYGVELAAVTSLFIPQNDIVYAAAEEYVPVKDFVNTLGSQQAFEPIFDKDEATAKLITGKNHVKLAIAEFAADNADWTFTDGFAVSDNDGESIVLSPSFSEPTSTWQFSSFIVPVSKDVFVEMKPSEKASVPAEDIAYGDISDCVTTTMSQDHAEVSMRF